MIEQRKQMLQKEVISTKQPSNKAMIISSIRYHLKLQLVIHTWVMIHPVMNFIISTPTNLAHLSARHKLQPRLLRSNPNSKPNTLPKKPARQKWTGPIYLPGHIYKLITLMRDLPLILTLMSLGITPKGQYKLSVFWMTVHPL